MYILSDHYIPIGADVGVLGGSAPPRSEGWGGLGGPRPPRSTPFGMFWVGSEEAQMESGGTVYIFKQLKKTRIKIFCICIICVLER